MSIYRPRYISFAVFREELRVLKWVRIDHRMYRIKPDIGKLPYLGFWASNASSLSKIGAVFNCYLLNKHPPIRLHEKTVQF